MAVFHVKHLWPQGVICDDAGPSIAKTEFTRVFKGHARWRRQPTALQKGAKAHAGTGTVWGGAGCAHRAEHPLFDFEPEME